MNSNYIIYTYYTFIALFFIYFVSLFITRAIVNKKYDKEFNINTTGTRNWEKGSLYNRTESTPYLALKSLYKNYSMKPEDNLVDFGSGRGRVMTFIHNKYDVSVVGIELNDLTYDEAVINIDSYLSKHENSDKSIVVKKEYAEKYEIGEYENKFFFFNPFDVIIFKQVVYNIIKSAEKYNKEVEIILYYPLSTYKKFLKEKTPFVLVNKVNSVGSIGFTEKFLIYRFSPNQ